MGTKVKDLTIETAPVLTDYAINERVGGAGVQPKRTTWQKIYDLFSASGLGGGTSASGISAAGTNQATATALTVTNNRVDTVASGTGVKDAVTAIANFTRTVQNNGANDLKYYPFLGNNFYEIGVGASAANAPVTIAPGNQITVYCYDAGVLTLK